MIKRLCNNLEIRRFLDHFQADQWKGVLELVIVYGIRKIYSKNTSLSIEGVRELVEMTQSNINRVICNMRKDIKELSHAVRRIEGRSNTRAGSGSSHRAKQAVKAREHSYSSCKLIREIKEPNVCSINKAQSIFDSILPSSEAFQTPLKASRKVLVTDPEFQRALISKSPSSQETFPFTFSPSQDYKNLIKRR